MSSPVKGALSPETRQESLELLWPPFAAKVRQLLAAAAAKGLALDAFETWRSPARQDALFAQGRSKPGKVVTQAAAWSSWHQYGLAVDVVFRDAAGGWTWTGDYDAVDKLARALGLERLSFERPHLQLTGGMSVVEAKKLYDAAGVQAVWLDVGRRLIAGGQKL